MIAIAPAALADITPAPRRGFTRFIRRAPLGLVFVAAPWNYPYLTAVNTVWPALLAGNTVILKPSHQTPLTAERFAAALAQAGLPEGVYQPLHLSHGGAASMMRAADFTAFTGSVTGGRAVRRALADGFMGAGLELGGKDPAYVRHDADIDHAVENLAEGAFFNAGQSCCGIERIYVHADVYDDFAAGLIRVARRYRLGDPRDRETTLGPMVRASAGIFRNAATELGEGEDEHAVEIARRFHIFEEGVQGLVEFVEQALVIACVGGVAVCELVGMGVVAGLGDKMNLRAESRANDLRRHVKTFTQAAAGICV